MKVFISSTTKDLEDARACLAEFIEGMGYEPIRGENADIGYGQSHVFQACIDGVKLSDMLVLIINDNIGTILDDNDKNKYINSALLSTKSNNKSFLKGEVSITHAEVLTAISEDIPIYVFIKHNENQTMKDFVDFINSLDKNNAIYLYTNISDIKNILKKQWAKEFKRLIDRNKISCGCTADWIVSTQQTNNISSRIISGTIDTSDLFFIMLSVVNCTRARISVQKIAQSMNIQIEAMYDVLGSWDLVIKYRSHKGQATKFYDEVLKNLKQKDVIDENENSIFGRKKFVNILAQSAKIENLLDIENKPNEEIKYLLLENNNSYELYRANRSFIYIDLPEQDLKITFLSELSKHFASSPYTAIVESICMGYNELIIETFSTCSQTNFIAKLNQMIDPVIAEYTLQKYTLTSYFHDETGLLSSK